MVPKVQLENKPLTLTHSKSLSQVVSDHLTVTLFGKLITDLHINPATSGIAHPQGLKEPLQVAEVVGYFADGRCVTLKPALYSLPAPDGPASGFGWDPEEYVMWTKMPRKWPTLKLSSSTGALDDLLQSHALPEAAAVTQLAVDQIVTVITDCISTVTGSTRPIVMANTLQHYGFEDEHQVDMLATYIVGNNDYGVGRYNFTMASRALSGMTNNWTLLNIFSVIQAKAVPD